MSFYIRAYIKDGEVNTLHASTLKIERDVAKCECDYRIGAIVSGDYMSAGKVRQMVSIDAMERLVSDELEITEQWRVEP